MNEALDGAVACEVMGWDVTDPAHVDWAIKDQVVWYADVNVVERTSPYKGITGTFSIWHPSRDIAIAFEVVAEMQRRGWLCDFRLLPDRQWSIYMYDNCKAIVHAFASTLAEAICRCALAAVRAQVPA